MITISTNQDITLDKYYFNLRSFLKNLNIEYKIPNEPDEEFSMYRIFKKIELIKSLITVASNKKGYPQIPKKIVKFFN